MGIFVRGCSVLPKKKYLKDIPIASIRLIRGIYGNVQNTDAKYGPFSLLQHR